MRFTLKSKQNNNEVVCEVNLSLSEGKIMFPVKLQQDTLVSVMSGRPNTICDNLKWSAIVDSLYFIDNLHKMIDSFMSNSDDVKVVQEGFVNFVEQLHIRIMTLSSLLELDADIDWSCEDEMITIMFWPLVSKIMMDAENGMPNDSSFGESFDVFVEQSARKILFRGIVHDNEQQSRKEIEEGRTGSEDEKEFFDFVTGVVDDICSEQPESQSEQ